MRQSREAKTQTHERIIAIASARIREDGIEAPRVAEIMQAAGLTHGGFYKHFDSRDDLIAEATSRALADGNREVRALTDHSPHPLAALIDWYASAGHRDDLVTGCPLAALGGDMRRADRRVSAAYGEQVERYLEYLQQLLGSDENSRQRATVALSTLVGSVILARAIGDHPLSDEILADVREALNSPNP